MERLTVRIPATAANLGPGYDTFGLALGLYNTFSAAPADEWTVKISGEGADTLARDSGNYVARAMALGLSRAGSDIKAAHIECTNGVPTGRGLGSSAVAIVGGLMLADALTDGALGQDGVFALAVEMEGHSDNVAAAVYGGFTIGWDDGVPHARSVTMSGGLAAVVVIAERELSTTRARDMLPGTVPHSDAAFNAARAGLVIAGVMSGDRELLAAGLHDRLHQPYRAAEVPDMERVTAALRAAGCEGAVLSGAGPTIVGLVLAEDDGRAFERARGVCESALAPLSMIPGRRPPVALAIDRLGATRL